MADFCVWGQGKDAVCHMQTCTENRNDTELFSGDFFCGCFYERSFDFFVCQRKVAACFIVNQHGNFGYKRAEFFCGGFLLAHDANFVLNQWVVHDIGAFWSLPGDNSIRMQFLDIV